MQEKTRSFAPFDRSVRRRSDPARGEPAPALGPAQTQSAVESAYSLATKDVTIAFNTGPDPKSGAAKLNSATALPVPEKIGIRCETSTGLIPEKISVVFLVTYNGIPGRYAIEPDWKAISRQGDHYEIPLKEFARKLLEHINNGLPLDFDPNAAPSFSTSADVEVTVTPIDKDNTPGSPKTVHGTLKLMLQRVLSDPSTWAESEKKKSAATSPDKPSRAQAATRIPARCPHCWTDDAIVHRAPAMWGSTSITAIGPSCPAATFISTMVVDDRYPSRPFFYRSDVVNRTCWP